MLSRKKWSTSEYKHTLGLYGMALLNNICIRLRLPLGVIHKSNSGTGSIEPQSISPDQEQPIWMGIHWGITDQQLSIASIQVWSKQWRPDLSGHIYIVGLSFSSSCAKHILGGGDDQHVNVIRLIILSRHPLWMDSMSPNSDTTIQVTHRSQHQNATDPHNINYSSTVVNKF